MLSLPPHSTFQTAHLERILQSYLHSLITTSFTGKRCGRTPLAYDDRSEYQKPLPNPQNVQHSPGLALYLGGGEFGRKPGSGCWDGAYKTIFWIDPTTGIAVSSPVDVKDDAEDGALGGMQHECLVAGKRQCGRTDGQCV